MGHRLQAWPNPCGDEMWIDLPRDGAGAQMLTLLYPDGRVARQEVLDMPAGGQGHARVDLAGLAPGFYFCTLSEEGGPLHYLRVIRQ